MLLRQLREEGFIGNKNPILLYALVAGKIKNNEKAKLIKLFRKNHWWLIKPIEIKKELWRFGKRKYENDVATMVVKLLMRSTKSKKTRKT